MRTLAAIPRKQDAGRGRRGRIAVLVLAAFALWLIIGLVRAPTLGAAAFAAFESPRTVSAIRTNGMPLYVSVEGTVTEATGNWYTSSQVFFIEPLTGWWLNLSQIDLAPSGG
ncbi:MAG TPA: hypothetical protein VF494_05335 [Candidatus Limnocylindrales bacterium]